MSTIVCQNFISCFESQHQLSETTTTTLKLKVALPHLDEEYDANLSFLNWGGAFQTIPKPESCYAQYPWVTKPLLTAKSLHLCTENLGSETGSDTVVVATAAVYEASTTTSFSRENPRRRESARTADFPPPLTTMTGENPLQVSRRREGDRLILEAGAAPFANPYIRIERSDGRLRMSYAAPPLTPSATDDGLETKEEEEEEEDIDADTAEEEEEEEGIDDGVQSKKEEEEMNLEKFHQQIVNRCMDGNHGSKQLCSNWKPAALWVATS